MNNLGWRVRLGYLWLLARLERCPHLLWLSLIGIFLAASIPYAMKASANASAFVRWHHQIQQLGDDIDIYQRHNYPNPPMMALLLYPLVQLPPVLGALCWYYLKAGMALLALSSVFRMVALAQAPQASAAVSAFPAWAQALVALLCLRPMLGDLAHGNVNLFILFLTVGALFAFQRGRDGLCGLVLALAMACKVTPALFVPYFLWKRAWKTLVGCALGLVVFVMLVPGTFLGWSRQLHLLESWTDQMVRPYVSSGKVLYTEHNNQSLPALVMRLTTASPSFSTWVGEHHVPVCFHNVLDLAPAQASWIVKGCLLLFAGLVMGVCRTPLQMRQGWRLPAEFSLVVLGMLLFSERTWKHHCVLLLLPVAVLVYCLAACGLDRKTRRRLIACLSGAVLLMAATSTGLLPDAWAKLAQTYGGYVWAHLLLGAALVVVLTQARKTDSRSA